MGKKEGSAGKKEITFLDLIDRQIEHHGVEGSKIIAIEEFAELTKEITKDLRGKFRKDFFMEEMADVFICFETLMRAYNIDKDEFEKYVVDKMCRNMNRIKNDVELAEVMKDVVKKGGATFL